MLSSLYNLSLVKERNTYQAELVFSHLASDRQANAPRFYLLFNAPTTQQVSVDCRLRQTLCCKSFELRLEGNDIILIAM